MDFTSDPPTLEKIRKMKQRVRWQDTSIVERSIDQTRLAIDDGFSDRRDSGFSFLVIGDTGSGAHPDCHPQRRVAELLLQHRDRSRFLLHTGDVVYQVGSSEYYPRNFIEPYREFLVGGERPERLSCDRLLFNFPFLPVLGNHDYYNLPRLFGVLAQMTWPLRHLLRTKLDLGVGWHGSYTGQAYAKAFIDYLQGLGRSELEAHLDRHYTALTDTGRCLRYQPAQFTRLPNRYYTFRYGGIDFFALDTNTFKEPPAIAAANEALRQEMEGRKQALEDTLNQLLQASAPLDPNNPEEAERLDDNQGKLNQLEESIHDIEKQLTTNNGRTSDFEQLGWLERRLIASWRNPEVRGRVVFFHHPPYVTETTKWDQAQTLQVRYQLREVFDRVAAAIGDIPEKRPIVDLVLSGHAHCLEYLQTTDTGHADAHINWIICGGSGHSLRRQRSGPNADIIMETFPDKEERKVARSLLYVGRGGQGSDVHRPYSALGIDVDESCPPKFTVRPYICDRHHHQWLERELEPFAIG